MSSLNTRKTKSNSFTGSGSGIRLRMTLSTQNMDPIPHTNKKNNKRKINTKKIEKNEQKTETHIRVRMPRRGHYKIRCGKCEYTILLFYFQQMEQVVTERQLCRSYLINYYILFM